ncbi:apses-domain-containing protein [Mucor ambiguus]|uniref:Apses-domain-containing protein n=1 Tax=Mucor ambiguus TaxID=91626 RepID=A0A0C9MJ24_9FUNG|nr:apses-domain-containing protein [Mucor ambiguus]
MADFSQIFKATYSGVPVYEMLCKGVAVMRRRSDSYLNATQILKVADFDKPQRTRILEREVQTGQHEKVQGGYGKYQGTWVPFERGRALAELYEVDDVLAPILQFVKGDESPPLAPKHVTAASARPRKSRDARARKRPKHFDDDVLDMDEASTLALTRGHDSNAKNGEGSVASPLTTKRSRTTKQKDKVPTPKAIKLEVAKSSAAETNRATAAQSSTDIKQEEDEEEEDDDDDMMEFEMSEKPYAQRLLHYFMSSKSSIPSLFTQPPADLDFNVLIDDEGHTSLHWAAAMARIKIVKLLIENGADMYRVNYKGQTALMRSVLFSNNFDNKTFESLLDLLRTTIFNIDKKDQTVFHHTAAMSDWKGKIYASRYYMECLINKLKNNQSELISILNVQDTNGDTALTIAAKIGNRRLIKLMIDAGASTEIANEDGMTPKDYFGEIEKNTAARASATSPPPLTSSPSEAGGSTMNEADTREVLKSRVEAMFKHVTSDPSTAPPISEFFDDFAESYEKDLVSREKMLQKKKIELNLYTKRLEETKKILLSANSSDDDAEIAAIMQKVETHGKALESKLRRWLQFNQKETLKLLQEKYSKEQDGNGAHGNSKDDKPPSPPISDTVQDLQTSADKLKDELKQLQSSRKKHVDTLIEIRCRLPPKKYQDYKRLISTCCNVAYENVEDMLTPLLESFDDDSMTLAGESLKDEKDQALPPPPAASSSLLPTASASHQQQTLDTASF